MNKLEKIKEINEKFQIEHLPLLYSVKKSLYSKNNDNIYIVELFINYPKKSHIEEYLFFLSETIIRYTKLKFNSIELKNENYIILTFKE